MTRGSNRGNGSSMHGIVRFCCASVLALWISLSAQTMAADAPYIAADDGTYLGEITCAGSKSIANKYGLYGSKYGVDSIWNRYGLYGSQYAVLSPYNRYASKPPKIFYPDDTYAYLTANAYLRPRISPVELQGMLMEKCGLDDPLRDE